MEIKTVNYNVSLGANSYPIIIGQKILEKTLKSIKKEKYSKIILVSDKNIQKKKKTLINKIILNLRCETIILPSGERIKGFKYLQYVIEKALKLNIDRNCLIICFGGGVLGDLVALASSLILRGVDYFQIPTTLLSQVDSSVGGKTAINSKYGKNLVGTFKQPKKVIISVDVLKSLEKREIFSGYAEILKYSFIKDKDFFKWLCVNGKKVLTLDPKSCIYAIKKSCSIKSKIVSVDEKEEGIREILNFGHTFGHVIESFTGYSNKITHGESIFIGMHLAIKFSIFLNMCNKKILEDFVSHCKTMDISYKLSDYKIYIKPKTFLKLIKFDKKVRDNKIKFILLKDIGHPMRFFLGDEKLLSIFLKNELK